MAEIIDESTFEEKVLKSDKPVMVDFYANWCGPCNEMIPVVDDFEMKHKDVAVYKVNVDKNIKLAEEYNILSVPTFMIFKNGREENRFMGGMEAMKFEKTAVEMLK